MKKALETTGMAIIIIVVAAWIGLGAYLGSATQAYHADHTEAQCAQEAAEAYAAEGR